MLDKNKLKSYALLLAYGADKTIEGNIKLLREEFDDDKLLHLYQQFVDRLRKAGGLPIDIYSWKTDWDEKGLMLYICFQT